LATLVRLILSAKPVVGFSSATPAGGAGATERKRAYGVRLLKSSVPSAPNVMPAAKTSSKSVDAAYDADGKNRTTRPSRPVAPVSGRLSWPASEAPPFGRTNRWSSITVAEFAGRSNTTKSPLSRATSRKLSRG